MKRTNRAILLTALVAVLAWGMGAQDQPVKIGVVDVDQALNATDEGKAAREEFARKERDARSQVEPLMKQYQDLQDELKSKKYVLSDQALFDKQVQLAELQNKIKSKIDEIDGQLKIEQGKMIKPLTEKMRTIVEQIGKEQGFTLILQRNSPYVMYSREALDITDMVVARFNKKS
jgi:outer membrane protein